MAETTRFGLEKFGGLDAGSITDRGAKFSEGDRDTIDRLFSVFEDHKHDGGATPVALASPTVVAADTIHTTGGTIPNGSVRYYQYSLIDQFGLETAGSPELTVTMPGLVIVTDIPVVTGDTVGGSALAEGSYYYALTGNTAAGETVLGPEAVITVQPGQNQVNAVLPLLPAGITSWNLWRQGVTEEGWTKVADSQPAETFADIGYASGDCLCDPTTQPPSLDLVSVIGTSSVTITPDATALATAAAWKLYVTDTSGNYPAASLVATVVPAVLGDPAPLDYLDTGAPLLQGQPLLVSQTLKPSHDINVSGYSISEFGAPTEDLDMAGFKITGGHDPVSPQDFATKAYVDAHEGLESPLVADLDFGGHTGTDAADPVNPQDLATKAYVDAGDSGGGGGGGGIANPLTADLDFGGFAGTDALDPVNPQDLATKSYVDTAVAGGGGGGGGGLTSPLTADLDFGGNKGTNGGTPVNPDDLVTKAYADAIVGGSGVAVKHSAIQAGDEIIPANVAASGSVNTLMANGFTHLDSSVYGGDLVPDYTTTQPAFTPQTDCIIQETFSVYVDALAPGDEVYVMSPGSGNGYGKASPDSGTGWPGGTAVQVTVVGEPYFAPAGVEVYHGAGFATLVYAGAAPDISVSYSIDVINGVFAADFTYPAPPSGVNFTSNGDGTATVEITFDDTDTTLTGWVINATNEGKSGTSPNDVFAANGGTSPQTETISGLTIGDSYTINVYPTSDKGQGSTPGTETGNVE